MSRGIYYHPPPPFVGGQQPHAPRQMAPQLLAVPENDPPFSTSRVRALLAVVMEWDVAAGWWQPFQDRKLNPSEIAVPENDPPFGLRRLGELQRQSWPFSYDLPALPGKFSHPTPVPPAVNDPPFGSRRAAELQRQSWPYSYSLPERPPRPLPQPSLAVYEVGNDANTLLLLHFDREGA